MDAVTLIEWILIFGGMVVLGMQAVTVFHTSRTRSNMQDLIEGIAGGMGHMHQKMESIEHIPQILQDLNLGGVQLMPQKSLGEIIMEKIMDNFREKKNMNPPQADETSWPEDVQPESPPLVSDSKE